MDGRDFSDDRLLSRAELAALAGVMRPAVTNWQRRYEDYPEPVRAGESELFSLRAVLGWLDSRRIPSRARASDEPPGFTYADRMRRNIDASDRVRRSAALPNGEASSDALLGDEEQRARQLARLLGPMADVVRGGASMTDYVALLLSLVFLRMTGDPRSTSLPRTTRVRSKAATAALLQEIGEAADEALRLRGVAPGMQTAIVKLEPREYGDIVEVIRLTDGLGIEEFRQLVDEFGTRAGLPSGEFFTPRPVVRLMRDAAMDDESTVHQVYDPYVRAGEMLDGVAERLGGVVPLTLHGESPQRGTLMLAGMNLSLHTVPVELGAGTPAPWNERGWPKGHEADLILTNPPFNARGAVSRPREGIDWPYGAPPPGSPALAWLQHVLVSLKDEGRAAVVMPVSAGASTDVREREIRGRLVEDGVVECIVALPPQLFSGAQVSVSLWFLRRSTSVCEEILFVDARDLGDKAARGPRVLSDEHVEAVTDTVQTWRRSTGFRLGRQGAGHLAVAAPLDAVRAAGYSLSPADYVDRWMSTASPADAATEASTTRRTLDAARHRTKAVDEVADALSYGPLPSSVPLSYDGLPRNWCRVPLGELVDITAGPSYSRLSADVRSPTGDLCVVMPKHLREGRIDDRAMEKVAADVARALTKFRLSPGDILCVRSGAQTSPALVEEAQDGWLFSTNLLRLRTRETAGEPLVLPRYLHAYLCLPETVHWLKEYARGTAVPSLSAATLALLPVPLPPVAHQRRVSATLGALDAQIAAHRSLVGAATRHRSTLAAHLLTGVLVPE
ncbi:putative type I restriction enzymeP M protein [Streptomyces hundungensis]|uniref:Putative type I restriction enzymeP M protein n=1 Tax=Streptomyces hundungensis TaxID=1077946 RepID=A0A387HFK0_9ACTN|nr:N-6 DNA methylase [Streptomyces hundungensis]AYG82259.1 putative type I restriction enzymeP M protein [Streptomyces hundungensis]